MNRLALFLPLALFAGLSLVLLLGLDQDPTELPSVLVGEPFPEFSLPSLQDAESLVSTEDFKGEVALVNVWATWCPSCIAEHGELTRIFETTGLRIIGINYNDDPDAARAWLKRWGDPYALHVVDQAGTLAIDLGVYGAPETFVIDAAGVIRYRHVGVVTQKVYEETLGPMIQDLQDAS